jgi:YD repeat-containing protein
VIGLASEFTYGSNAFITSLKTPYGTTTFTMGETGLDRWLEIRDPMGGTERVEYNNYNTAVPASEPAVPAGMTNNNTFLSYRNTFFWDKRAMMLHPRDYTKAKLFHWLKTLDMNQTSGVLEGEKNALEGRIWYAYASQPGPYFKGTDVRPTKVGRILDDGATQLYQYEYNSLGKVTRKTDPLGRAKTFTYDTSGHDLLEVRQVNGQSTDLLGSYTYNAQHQVLTATDTAGQTTTFTYLPDGRVQTIVTPPRGGLTLAQRTTTYAYYADNAPNGPGKLQSITGSE